MEGTHDCTIVVVEDEQPLANAIKTKLKQTGHAVVTARSTDQAYGYLTDIDNVCLVWLDHYLLGAESGLDLVRKMKEEGSNWREIPVVVVSNTASEDKVKTYLHLGVDKYYTKSNESLGDIVDDVVALLHTVE